MEKIALFIVVGTIRTTKISRITKGISNRETFKMEGLRLTIGKLKMKIQIMEI